MFEWLKGWCWHDWESYGITVNIPFNPHSITYKDRVGMCFTGHNDICLKCGKIRSWEGIKKQRLEEIRKLEELNEQRYHKAKQMAAMQGIVVVDDDDKTNS